MFRGAAAQPLVGEEKGQEIIARTLRRRRWRAGARTRLILRAASVAQDDGKSQKFISPPHTTNNVFSLFLRERRRLLPDGALRALAAGRLERWGVYPFIAVGGVVWCAMVRVFLRQHRFPYHKHRREVALMYTVPPLGMALLLVRERTNEPKERRAHVKESKRAGAAAGALRPAAHQKLRQAPRQTRRRASLVFAGAGTPKGFSN